MNTPFASTENVREPLLSRGELVGISVIAGAVGSVALMTKMAPEVVQNFAEHALNFLGVNLPFESPVVSPQDGGPVMS